MATNLPASFTNKEIAEFDSVAIEIKNIFNQLIAELVARRDTLLKDLFNLKSDYSDKEMMRIAAIEEIENAQQLMYQLSVKVNANISAHKEATDVYKNRLQQLETPTKLPQHSFNYPRLKELQTLISEFGEVSETEPLKQDKLQNRETITSPLSSVSSLPSQEYIGRLAVTLAQARLNKSYSKFLMDPYCKFNISNTDYRTTYAVNGGKTPEWNECFYVALLKSSTGLDIEILDRQLFSDHLRIAWAHIKIPTIVFDGEIVEDWFPLDGKLGEGKEGTILITFKLN